MQTLDPRGSFAKNLILSLALIGVTSLLILLELKQVDDRKATDQQRYQDQLSRQDPVLDAQANLIDTMAADFREYELYASDPVISRDLRYGDPDWHERAVQHYDTRIGPRLGTVRAGVRTFPRLAPERTDDLLMALCSDNILRPDGRLLE